MRNESWVHRVKRHLPLGMAALALVLTALGSGESKRPAVELLSGSSALEHIRFLSSDELGGRGNGSEGLEEAAQYIASQFERLGLEPAGEDGSFFQAFTVTLAGTLGPDNSMRLEGAGLKKELELHKDFEPMTFSATGNVEGAELVFVGYGITAPEHGYDDYAELDVSGKVVLVLRHVPREERHDGPFDVQRGHATFTAKVVNAKRHGAAAVVIVTDPNTHDGDPDELVRFGTDLRADKLDIPTVHVKRSVAEKLFQTAGKDLSKVQEKIDENLSPISFELPEIEVDLSVDIHRKKGEVRNVLGYLSPENAWGDEELLVIGAHYDHLGRSQRHSTARNASGRIHNGADDNASGTAGVLELARVLSGEKERLQRGVLFATFAGEEMGLLGSRYYTRNPTFPLERTVAMLNLDMIGRLRGGKLYIGGVGSSPVFRPKLEELGEAEELTFNFSFSGYGASDHTSFTLEGVPALFFFTGLHRDYHKPSDDWERIDAAGEQQVLRVVYQTADFIQSLPERPQFVRATRAEHRTGGGGGGYGAYFGSVPDFGYDGKGVRFDDIRDGSPADEAGLKAGDILVYFDGIAIDNLYDFTDGLRRHKPGDDVPVIVKRDGKSMEFRVKLSKRP